MNTTRLVQDLKKFKLSGMANNFEMRLSEALTHGMGVSEFMQLLMQDELTSREENRHRRLFEKARLPAMKSITEFDFSFQPSISKNRIIELSTCAWIDKHENVIFVGQPGTGKTHLALALAGKALRQDKTVLFTSASEMANRLLSGVADNTHDQKKKQYLTPDLLVIDELGYKTMSPAVAVDFFEIIRSRHERKSTMITSNKEVSAWSEILVDKTLTSALLDCLMQYAHLFHVKGESYRIEHRISLNQQPAPLV